MGQRDTFSASDIGKINRMYQCNRKPSFGFGLTGNGPATFPATIQHSTTQRPISHFGLINSNTNAAGGSREDRNPIREIFKAYTSSQFWQRLFSSWLFSQPQPRHQLPQQFYSDAAYGTNYPYFFGQGYYG